MKTITALAGAAMLGLLALRAQIAPATHIPRDDVQATVDAAPDDEVSDQQIRMVDAGDHAVGVGVVQRPPMERTSEPGGIQHHRLTETYRVLEGRGTLVTGGTLEDPTDLDPDGRTVRQLTGPSSTGTIRGGSSRRIGPGDIVIVPAGTPHGFSEIEERITYLLFRTDPDELLELK